MNVDVLHRNLLRTAAAQLCKGFGLGREGAQEFGCKMDGSKYRLASRRKALVVMLGPN